MSDTDKVWKAIKGQPIAMMTTADGEQLHSRPMAGYCDESEGAIFFITRLETGKTDEIGRRSPVNLGYADTSHNTYVSIAGEAEVSRDRAKLRELWGRWAEAWLPEGPDAPDTALITVRPEEATMWDSTSSRLIMSLKMLKGIVTQSPPDGGTVTHVKM